MPAFSISATKAQMTRKAGQTIGELAPTSGEGIEIRVNEGHFVNKRDFWTHLERLEQLMHEHMIRHNPFAPN